MADGSLALMGFAYENHSMHAKGSNKIGSKKTELTLGLFWLCRYFQKVR